MDLTSGGVNVGRTDKVNRQLHREISAILQQQLEDPRLSFVTLTRVDISRDLMYAKVYYSVLGDHQHVEAAKAGLEGARGMVRRLISQRMNMRCTPEIVFIYDKSVEQSCRIEQALEEIRHESGKNPTDDSKA
ncbi:MAG: ribosome-binding factor A [Omnitrophica WOR_2 bacterium GWA2_45_18]|nr:MAG: ribosome-binding factor A [Omnitrophica WOR_2 bacterium GWA2_45_18]